MSRKINGKWYRRAWMEGTKSEAQRTCEKMNRGSPQNVHVMVPEIQVTRSGDRDKVFSIYFRPKHFRSEKERKHWNSVSQDLAEGDRKERISGRSPTYIILAR